MAETDDRSPIGRLLEGGPDEEDASFLSRVKAKANAWDAPDSPTGGVQKASGLGDMFQNAWSGTDEDLARRARVTTEEGYEDEAWDEVLAQIAATSCAFFAQEVLTGPAAAPYNGRFLVAPHHEDWDDLVRHHHRLCVLAPRDHGKCQRGDALILTPSGERVRIDEWAGGTLIAYDPKTHGFVEAYAPPSRPNGVKRVLRVTTRTGRRVEVTENHPLRLLEGWQRADRLEVGQRIAVPYTTPVEGSGNVPDAWLLGLLVGDGGLTGSNAILTSADSSVVSRVRGHHDLTPVKDDPHSYRVLGLQKRLRAVGLMGKSSWEKRVPEALFQAKNSWVSQFIAGYLDADAHVNFHGGGSVEFYSVSEDLLRDVQHLLTRLGVLAVLSPKRGRYQGEEHLSWRLTVRGKDIATLAGEVSPEGYRGEQLKRLAKQQAAKGCASGDALDRFPETIWDRVEHSEDWFRKHGHPRPARGYQPTREKVQKVGEAEGNADLLALAHSPVLWDEVVAIDDLGEDETWSVHVPGYENYLADDVVNHNTFFFDFAYPIWRAAHQPDGKGYIFSATAPQAQRILEDIKEELESNPRLQWLVPDKKDNKKWTGSEIQLTNGHRIYARGFGTKIRGAHPNWIVVDDGLNDEDMYSELVRDKHVTYFLSAITNMIVPGGQIIVVGTPFHQADLYARLEKNEEYTFRRFQALTPDGEPLWPERYSREMLEARRREIGSIQFTREFQCDPISDDMSLFPSYLFKGEPTEQYTCRLGEPLSAWVDRGIVGTFMGVDFAMSSSVGADYTVVFVMGTDRWNNRWILDIRREKGLSYQAQLSIINEVARLYEPGLVFLEANQMQRIFGDELIRTTDLPIKQFVTGVQKNSIDKGVPSLRVLLENHKFRIPRGDRHSIEMTSIWMEEMRNFTWHDGKLQGVGTHDDTVMACWICDQAVKQGAFSFDFGDGYEDVDQDEVMRELIGDDEGSAPEVPETEIEGANLVDEDDLVSGLLPSFLSVGGPFD